MERGTKLRLIKEVKTCEGTLSVGDVVFFNAARFDELSVYIILNNVTVTVTIPRNAVTVDYRC